ncbi:cobalamin biosynthesis protein CobW [Arthrobacter sp. SW1]|uniref:CobW family GTP-binding protein n=1 Tax=Arthrobacter sp. SW1 TaxID=1920889 RepID=UPI000877B960|nr:GTP-binding protein [Arthrobacter sp. SW1]OFI38147.1 cobalamin biosynthesis protein CobW [Arthrobacter sp. SW1]
MAAIPVIVLTGYLGAGKTSLLNHLLRQPGARVGVIVNDFGDINVDAGLVTGQIDEPASISGGCICCLEDAGGLDDALDRLSAPRLALDVIIIEASGLAEPLTLRQLVQTTAVERVRFGGLVDVIDAVEHFRTVDTKDLPPLRYSAASLAIVNKLDLVPAPEREETLERITLRIRERNSRILAVGASGAAVDPELLYDVASMEEDESQLPLRQLLIEAQASSDARHAHAHDHQHAKAVTVASQGSIDPDRILDFLEKPPAGVYRIKGTITTRHGGKFRAYAVNVVGAQIHIATSKAASENVLVAIGLDVDAQAVRTALEEVLSPIAGPGSAKGHERLRRYQRLSH